jgi:hypothetical protein
MTVTPSRHLWWKRLLLVVAGLLAGLLLGEGMLWAVGVSYPLMYVPDPHCGTRLRPGFRFLYMKEGQAWVEINSDGQRDVERSRDKPPGTFRIAVLGDSYAEAFQVDRDATFWAVLERRLNETCFAETGIRVEVLNFGVSGYGTTQQLQMLRHYVWPYEPDLVLLAFLTGNDLHDNTPELSDHPVRPFYVRKDGEWELDESFRQHPTYRHALSWRGRTRMSLVNRSRLLQTLLEMRRQWQQPAPRADGPGEETAEDTSSRIYLPPQDPRWDNAWETTEYVLQRMHEEVNEKGARFLVATLSNAIQVDPDPGVRDRWMDAHGVDDLFFPDRRIEAIGRESSFPVVLLAPRLQREAEEHGVHLHGFENTRMGTGHWNETGHRIAGEILARELCGFWPE